jgi:plasmid stabilization system protein ParE
MNLAKIFGYLAKYASIEIAKNVKYGVLEQISTLLKHAKLGQLEEDLCELGKNHRRLVYKHYKIVYRIEKDTIYITDIFDSRQDPEKIKP